MRKKLPYFGAFFAIALGAWFAIQSGDKGTKTISTAEVKRIIERDTNIVILDVRRYDEYQSETGHLKNAVIIPVQDLGNRIGELEKYKDKKIITYCRTGRRSGVATGLLNKKGFTVFNMEGGILEWNGQHFPVVLEK